MKTLSKVLLTGAVIAAVKGLDNRLEITHYTAVSKKIPKAFDGFKICLFSDLHNDTTAGLSDAVRGEHPDIICIPGDMTNDKGSFSPFISLLDRLVDIAPVYITSGNHDVWRSDYNELVSACKKMGAYFLEDENAYIEKDSSKIRVCGICDPVARSAAATEKNLFSSLEKIQPEDIYTILLFHRANLFDFLSNSGFDLILSGHMHGGQIRIPGIGGFVSPKTNVLSGSGLLFPNYISGEFNKNNTKMIVTRGIGNPSFIPRLYNRPELCSITLKSID